MRRTLSLVLLLATLSAGPASAAPEFRLLYPNGVPRVEITGSYSHSRYTVWRSGSFDGPYTTVTENDVLCVGPCFADDYTAVGGRTYWYRFDLSLAEGGGVSFGPYRATISRELARPLSVSVSPNPGSGPASVSLIVASPPGTSVEAQVAIFDLQGRRLAWLFRGSLPSGQTRLAWNGLGGDGRRLAAGVYMLRAVTSDGRSITVPLVRSR